MDNPSLGINASHDIVMPPQVVDLLAQSYQVLRESVYAELVTQTRLKPYLDSVELVVDEKEIGFDTSALLSMLEAKKGVSERDGLIDLVE
ncbi:hypothetical protein, partial [Salmonella enterica]|uniref:hypothetical protein n=1 Tax=Salmonella enterica TaxID=28901 RepID=UPI0035278EDA